jgi:hypothetical protein
MDPKIDAGERGKDMLSTSRFEGRRFVQMILGKGGKGGD